MFCFAGPFIEFNIKPFLKFMTRCGANQVSRANRQLHFCISAFCILVLVKPFAHKLCKSAEVYYMMQMCSDVYLES